MPSAGRNFFLGCFLPGEKKFGPFFAVRRTKFFFGAVLYPKKKILGLFLLSAGRKCFLGLFLTRFWGLFSSLACVACVARVAILKIMRNFRNFRNFACLPNSPNLEYFEKFGIFPFPPCVLSFLKVHCHPNFPIIPSATCTRTCR